ncbi:MAG: efflux RND transporter periplasmic adaptor subunit [Microcoleus sp. SIO2G3]|nr:efflux RND transporter periplasmic adaptor subunit [Microcoleus sp. SIO2G3]
MFVCSNPLTQIVLAGLLVSLSGCSFLTKTQAEAQTGNPGSQQGGQVTPVDVAIAKTGTLQEETQFTGTTLPVREVSLRAQVEGRLLNLQVGRGDAVKQGQILAQLDDSLLMTSVSQAQAELGALQSEVARAEAQVNNARALAEQARVELKQAQVDAARRQTLGNQGAISQQEAELAQTAAQTAQQKLQSALEQIRTEQQAVEAAKGRVAAQQAAVAQERERRSYALIASPINGVVLEQISEPGNLIQPGGEILRIGDFSRVKVVVPVSELELANIRVGQPVRVSLDAFPNDSFSGRVTRISPAADQAARQVPVEITIPNSNGRIGSGLLSRVNFASTTQERVVVPETALQEAGRGRGAGGAGERGSNPSRSPSSQPTEGTVFTVTGTGSEAKVQARRVQVGDRVNGQVEILSGLQPGERFVSRSGKPLKAGETVRLSILSRTPQQQEQR